MEIRKHPYYNVWLREDGAILMPPSRRFHNKYHWTFGSVRSDGYMIVSIANKTMIAHRLIAEAFIPNPNGYPTVDHISRNKSDNRIENLRWASRPMQQANRKISEDCKEKYGIRECEDSAEYNKRYKSMHYREMRENGYAYRKVHGKRQWVKISTQLDLF